MGENISEPIATESLVETVINGIQEKKGSRITVLDLRNIENMIAEFFVICEGDSNVHVDAVADSVEEIVRKDADEKPLHVEGKRNAEWVLLDYMNVVVHVFQKQVRSYYSLEDLWADAERKDIADLF
jgi:ribosome-associated protein